MQSFIFIAALANCIMAAQEVEKKVAKEMLKFSFHQIKWKYFPAKWNWHKFKWCRSFFGENLEAEEKVKNISEEKKRRKISLKIKKGEKCFWREKKEKNISEEKKGKKYFWREKEGEKYYWREKRRWKIFLKRKKGEKYYLREKEGEGKWKMVFQSSCQGMLLPFVWPLSVFFPHPLNVSFYNFKI